MDTVGARHRLEAGERFHAGFTWYFITRNSAYFSALLAVRIRCRRLDRHQLLIETSFRDSARRAQLRLEAETIGILARDAVLGGDALGAFELAGELKAFAVLARNGFAEAGLRTRDRIR